MKQQTHALWLLASAALGTVCNACLGPWHGTNCDQPSLVVRVTSGASCEASNADYRTIIGGPDLCRDAHQTYKGLSSKPSVQLYGDAGCDIGTDGVDYGFCNGNSNSKPRGCSDKSGTAYHNERTSIAASCSSTYACLCYNDRPNYQKVESGLCTDYGYTLLTQTEVSHFVSAQSPIF